MALPAVILPTRPLWCPGVLVAAQLVAGARAEHREVGEEGDVPQQLLLGRGPGDQGEDGGAGRTPGPDQGADVVIIAGEVDQEAGGLVADVLGSSVLGLRGEKILQKTWKKRVEVMVPVRKQCQVCECQ